MVRYEEIFKDPCVLDFLGLKGAYSEKDLEAAIIHKHDQTQILKRRFHKLCLPKSGIALKRGYPPIIF